VYDLIAIDLDGTMLDERARVTEPNARAVARAREAGVLVTFCTGRGLVESRFAYEACAQTEPVIVAGGAIVACPATGATLHRFAMHPALVHRVVADLLALGVPALVLKDPVAAGYDYLVVRGEDNLPLAPTTVWWFEELGVNVRFAASIDEDEHPEHTVRVGVVARRSAATPIGARVRASVGEAGVMHHFPAVVGADHGSRDGTEEPVDIVEVFDRRAHKWSAIEKLAGLRGLENPRVCTIGNDVNDITMLRAADLGVAVANSIPEALDAADRVAPANSEDGVAFTIDRILSGEW